MTELPLEIWLRIISHVKEPKNLCQTSKKLLHVSRSVPTIVRWLVNQYGKKDAFFGLLWFWSKSDQFKRWLIMKHEDIIFPPLSMTLWARPSRAIKTYQEGWFYLSKKSKCNRCSVTGHEPSEYFKRQCEKNLHSAIINHINASNNTCPLEQYQLELCKALLEFGAPIDNAFYLILRFAASIGHSKLVGYLISTAASPKEEFDPLFSKIYNIEDQYLLDSVLILLEHSILANKITCFFLALKSNCLSGLSRQRWKVLFRACVQSGSFTILSLFCERYTQLTVADVEEVIRTAVIPFTPKSRKQDLEQASTFLLSKLSRQDILAEQEILGYTICECGRTDLIIALYDIGCSFNHAEGIYLFNAILFGNSEMVKTLLDVCGVELLIFHSGRKIMITIAIFNHCFLFFATLTSFIGVINEIFCRILKGQGPMVMLFLAGDYSNGLCYSDGPDTSPWSSIVVFLFFLSIFLLFNMFVKFIPLCKNLFLLRKRIAARQKVGLIEILETQESNMTIQNLPV